MEFNFPTETKLKELRHIYNISSSTDTVQLVLVPKERNCSELHTHAKSSKIFNVSPFTSKKHNPTCRTKLFYPNPDRSKAKQLLNLPRKKSRRRIEAITGQNNLHYVQNKIKKTDHLCRLCEEEEETFQHFINDFPCLRQARQEHFRLSKIEKSHAWTIRRILEYSRIKEIDLGLKGEDSSDFKRERLNVVRF